MADAAPRTNWFERSLERVLEDSRRFFWDAVMALKLNSITGDYVEFGSWGGKSLAVAHETLRALDENRHLWAFDSFQGLPEATSAHDEHPAWGTGGRFVGMGTDVGGGDDPSARGLREFHESCARFGVPRSAYTTVVGFFEDSLRSLGATGAPTDIALAYVDCNMHSSSVTVLEFLEPRLKHGMIVAFDDYSMWSPDDVSGQRRALHDFATAHPEWTFQPFKDVHWGGRSFVVERTSLLEPRHQGAS